MALTTLADIKKYMKIDVLDTTNDILLGMFKDSVEQAIINYCETDFTQKVVTSEIIDGILADVILPKNFPLISVQQVMLGVDGNGTNGYEVAPEDYKFSEAAITLTFDYTPFARNAVKIAYTWGYAAVPADIKLAVYQCVKAEFQRYERNTEDISSRSKGDESESFAGAWDSESGLPKQILSKIAYYRSVEFPNIPMHQRNL